MKLTEMFLLYLLDGEELEIWANSNKSHLVQKMRLFNYFVRFSKTNLEMSGKIKNSLRKSLKNICC